MTGPEFSRFAGLQGLFHGMFDSTPGLLYVHRPLTTTDVIGHQRGRRKVANMGTIAPVNPAYADLKRRAWTTTFDAAAEQVLTGCLNDDDRDELLAWAALAADRAGRLQELRLLVASVPG